MQRREIGAALMGQGRVHDLPDRGTLRTLATFAFYHSSHDGWAAKVKLANS